MNSFLKAVSATRSFSTSGQQCNLAAKAAKLKEVQRLMQMDDGKPVFLKRGASDRLVFGGIALYTAVGVIMAGHFIFNLMFPPKNKN